MHTFYNGLSDSARTIIDASIGGALMKKTTDQAYEILEDTTTNTNQWPRDRLAPRKSLVGADTEVLSNMVNHVAQLTKQLQKQKGTVNAIQNNPWEIYKSCRGQYNTMDCQSRQRTIEQAQYVNQQNQQQQGQYGGNTYQIGTRIKIIIKARVREVTKIIKAIRTMVGGTTRIVCHHFKRTSRHLRRKWIWKQP